MVPETKQKVFTLPAAITTVADVSRLITELENLENFLRTSAVRQTGSPMTLPKLSPSFDDVVDQNELNMLQPQSRNYLMETLVWLRERAPQVHISFSSEPSQQFKQKLTSWLRANISPYVLIRVGLQPAIGVGCMLRTTNKMFDLSLSQRFEKQKSALVSMLAGGQPTNEVLPNQTEVQSA